MTCQRKSQIRLVVLRVRSVQRWPDRHGGRRGRDALRSRGPAFRPKLSDVLFAVLEDELANGPVAHGWADQRWTLARHLTLFGRRCHKSMTLSGIRPVGPSSVTRKQAGWVKDVWPHVEPPERHSGPGAPSTTKPGSR